MRRPTRTASSSLSLLGRAISTEGIYCMARVCHTCCELAASWPAGSSRDGGLGLVPPVCKRVRQLTAGKWIYRTRTAVRAPRPRPRCTTCTSRACCLAACAAAIWPRQPDGRLMAAAAMLSAALTTPKHPRRRLRRCTRGNTQGPLGWAWADVGRYST